jgi:hypothetical protein
VLSPGDVDDFFDMADETPVAYMQRSPSLAPRAPHGPVRGTALLAPIAHQEEHPGGDPLRHARWQARDPESGAVVVYLDPTTRGTIASS